MERAQAGDRRPRATQSVLTPWGPERIGSWGEGDRGDAERKGDSRGTAGGKSNKRENIWEESRRMKGKQQEGKRCRKGKCDVGRELQKEEKKRKITTR